MHMYQNWSITIDILLYASRYSCQPLMLDLNLDFEGDKEMSSAGQSHGVKRC